LELLRRRRKDAIFFLERKNLKNPNQIKGIKRKPPGSDQKSPVLVSAPEVGGAVFSSSPCGLPYIQEDSLISFMEIPEQLDPFSPH